MLRALAGALVVAWLVWQYIYTVYFDTTPHRVTPQIGGPATATARPGSSYGSPTVAPTATRFVEIAPPLVVGTVEEVKDPTPGTGTPVPSATPTIEPLGDGLLAQPPKRRGVH